jgi:hypothetical protein
MMYIGFCFSVELRTCRIETAYPVCLVVQILWLHNDKPVRETKDFELLVEGDRCSLIIREVYLEDSGEYKCTARNTHGLATTSARLMVERKLNSFSMKILNLAV